MPSVNNSLYPWCVFQTLFPVELHFTLTTALKKTTVPQLLLMHINRSPEYAPYRCSQLINVSEALPRAGVLLPLFCSAAIPQKFPSHWSCLWVSWPANHMWHFRLYYFHRHDISYKWKCENAHLLCRNWGGRIERRRPMIIQIFSFFFFCENYPFQRYKARN